MTFANVSRALVTVGTLLLAAPVGAAEVSYHLSGKVNYIQGTAQAKLAGLGVTNGANVSIDWTVELTTPPYFDNPNGTKEYHGAITAMKIQIGTWTTQGADPTAFNTIPVNKIDIYHGPTAPHEDDLEMRRSGVDTSDPNTGLGLVTGNDPNDALIFIRLVALMGGASTDNVLGDQDPSKYLDTSGGSVTGVDGVVGFAIPGVAGPPPPDPTVKCRTAQIASAATLCQSTLKCLAVRAKQTPAQIAKNPASLQTCRDKASSKFVTAFDKATASAVAKSLSCGTTEPAATFVTHFDTAVDDVVAVVDTVTPPNALLSSSWYSDAAVMRGRGEGGVEGREEALAGEARSVARDRARQGDHRGEQGDRQGREKGSHVRSCARRHCAGRLHRRLDRRHRHGVERQLAFIGAPAPRAMHAESDSGRSPAERVTRSLSDSAL